MKKRRERDQVKKRRTRKFYVIGKKKAKIWREKSEMIKIKRTKEKIKK